MIRKKRKRSGLTYEEKRTINYMLGYTGSVPAPYKEGFASLKKKMR